MKSNLIIAAALIGQAFNAHADLKSAGGEQASQTSAMFDGAKMKKDNQPQAPAAAVSVAAKADASSQSGKTSLFGRIRLKLSGGDVKPNAVTAKKRRGDENSSRYEGVVPVILSVVAIVGASVGLAYAASKIPAKQNWNSSTSCTDPQYGEDFQERWYDNDGDGYSDEYWAKARNFYYRDCRTTYTQP